LLEDATVPLPDLVRHLVWLMREEVGALETRIATVDQQLARIAREHPIACRLQQVPGVGGLNRVCAPYRIKIISIMRTIATSAVTAKPCSAF
jgi:hypothetical protein